MSYIQDNQLQKIQNFSPLTLPFYSNKEKSVLEAKMQQLNKVWSDQSLFGHFLTNLSTRCYHFATSSLNWHLKPDGTDRRFSQVIYDISQPSLLIEKKGEYRFVPFKILEFMTKRGLGGFATMMTGIISPLGLAAKSIHLLSRCVSSSFSHNPKKNN